MSRVTKIVGGVETLQHEFPWMASVTKVSKQVIDQSEAFILTIDQSEAFIIALDQSEAFIIALDQSEAFIVTVDQ